jgi:glyoxylase I family protein
MEMVAGIGGLFFRARDPGRLAQWYRDHLGLAPVPGSYETEPWRQKAGPTVFAPFPSDTNYFGNRRKAWMINFWVRDLGAMAAQLNRAGIKVEIDRKRYLNGRFARLYDPEGNAIELWQSKNPKPAKRKERR